MPRPTIEIDWEEFDKLSAMQCPLWEIANWFECSEDTIERRVRERFGVSFAEHNKQKGVKGRVSLRRKQFEIALSGNVTMLIFLGKQYLGQSDKINQDVTSNGKALIIHHPEGGSTEVIYKNDGKD